MERNDHLDHYMELMEQRSERGPVPADEQVRVLQELGLTVTDAAIAQARNWGEESSELAYSCLLVYTGAGSYDDESGAWTPTSSQVFSHDGEMYNLMQMYQIYLQGLQSISEGELTFRDIAADYSGADYETPGGTVEIRFTLNGKECRYEAQFMGDWLDYYIRNEVNRCLAEQGIEKRFYATDTTQGEVIFFCTEAWAQEFEKATLCYMSDTVQ